MSNKNNIRTLEGLFIYHDNKNRTVYVNPLTKKNYVLHSEDFTPYSVYSSRWIIALMVGVFINYLFGVNVWISVCIGVAVFAVMTVLFYVRFLPTLPTIKDFKKPERENLLKRNAASLSTSRIMMVAILGPILGGMIIYNLIVSKYEGMILYLNWLLVIAILGYSIFNLFVFIKRRRSSNKSIRQTFREDMLDNFEGKNRKL